MQKNLGETLDWSGQRKFYPSWNKNVFGFHLYLLALAPQPLFGEWECWLMGAFSSSWICTCHDLNQCHDLLKQQHVCETRSLLWTFIYLGPGEWEGVGSQEEPSISALVRPLLPPLVPPWGPSNTHVALAALLSCCIFKWESSRRPDGDSGHGDRSEWQ